VALYRYSLQSWLQKLAAAAADLLSKAKAKEV